MSRTIRRKNYVPTWVTTDWTHPFPRSHGWIRVPLEGKKLSKALAKYHSCKHGYWKFPTKFTRQDCEVKHRSKARNELAKYKKDFDYEVILARKELLPWD